MNRSSANIGSNPRASLPLFDPRPIYFLGVEIRWKTEIDDGETPREATFHFPGGLSTSSISWRPWAKPAPMPRPLSPAPWIFKSASMCPARSNGRVNWTPSRDGFIQSYCNTVPTPEGGTHESGFWAAILKGIKAYGELVNNRKASNITRDDLTNRRLRARSLVSSASRNSSAKPKTVWPLSKLNDWSKTPSVTGSTIGLAADTKSAGAILDFLVLRAEERLRRRQGKRDAAQICHQETAPAGKTHRLHLKNP